MNPFSVSSLTTAIQSAFAVAEDAIIIPLEVVTMISSFSAGFAVMIHSDLRLTVILFVVCIPMVLAFSKMRKKVSSLQKERKKCSVLLNETVARLEGYLTIKSFAREDSEIERFRSVSSDYKRIAIAKKLTTQDSSLLINIINSIQEVIIVVYLMLTFDGNLAESVSTGLLFYNLSGYLFGPLLNIPDLVDMITDFNVHVETNIKILEKDDEEDVIIELEEFNDDIEFKNVAFSYSNSKSTLKNINLKINKGEKVGIYGPSRSGKSTFVNLLNRFFPVNGGEILIDGININRLTKKSLRKIIGNVNQEIYLFSDMSIKDNIKYGIKCSDEEVIKAAKLANADGFISKLRDGYDSMIGNNGVMLSGGERQRVALARLFLLNPPILILDEATSKLDNESELLIKESLDLLSKDKTVISIAHRFATIENSDVLVGIKGHTIYECGKADEIKATGKLWNHLHN